MSTTMRLSNKPAKKRRHAKALVLGIWIILFLIIAPFALIWLDGKLFNSTYFSMVDALNADTPYSIQIVNYNRGLLHSSAKLYITNKTVPQNPDDRKGFIIDQTITHGPFLYSNIKNGYTFAAAAINSKVMLGNAPNATNLPVIATVETLASFNNYYQNKINSIFVNKTMPTFLIQWPGLSGSINFSLKDYHIHSLQMDIKSAPLSIKFQNMSLSVSDFELKNTIENPYRSNIAPNVHLFWNGSQSVSIPQIQFNIQNDQYTFNQFNYLANFGFVEKKYYNYTSQVTLQKIVTPEITVTPFAMNFGVTGLDAHNLTEFLNQLDFSSIQPMNKDAITPYLFKIITPDFKIKYDLAGTTSFGKAVFNLNIFWPQTIPLPTNIADMQNIQGNLVLTVPTGLLRNLIGIYFTKQQEANAKIPPAVTPDQTLASELDASQDDDEITTSIKTRIDSLINQHPNSDAFKAYMKQLVITDDIAPDLAVSLMNQYQLAYQYYQDQQAQLINNPDAAKEPKSIAEQVDDKMNQLKENGYFVESDGNYTLNMVFEHGQLMMNGKPFSPQR